MTETRKITIRRILVPLASSGKSQPALEMAARLAAGFEAELVGIYLREPEFLTAAALPISRFSYGARMERQTLDVTNMERALRVRAAQVRNILEATAQRMNLRWSFQDITGNIDEMIVQAAHDFDLITLNYLGSTFSGKAARAATAEKIPERSFSSLFMMQRGLMEDAPVLVLLNGGISALEPAAKIALLFGRELNILITTAAGQGEEKLTKDLRSWLGGQHQPARLIMPHKAGVESILSAINEIGPALLVMGRSNPLREDKAFTLFMSRFDCPLLLVAG